jgi:hypothetical protein
MKRINSTLPEEVFEEIKKEGFKIPELIKLGLLAKKNNPQLFDRFADLQEQISVLRSIMRNQASRIKDLERKDKDE